MKTSSLLMSGLLFGVAGLGGCTATVYNPPPAPIAPPAVAEADDQAADEPNEVVVEEEVVEIQEDPKIVYVEIETGPDYFSHHARLHGPGIVNFNTGYADGWAAATFFNHGQPLADSQIDRLLEVGRRQGDPTGKLGLPGYQEGYRAGARHYHNPYRNRVTPEQWARQREVQGLPVRPFPGRKVRPVVNTGTNAGTGYAERQEARRKELEAAKAKIDAERKAREQAFDQREAERKAKLEAAKNNRELAHDQREAARDKRETDFKAKLEADKKAREDERQKQELARKDRETQLKAKVQAEQKARELEHQKQELARKDRDAALKSKTEAARAKQEAERKQRELARQQKKDDHKEKVAQRKDERMKDKDKNKDGEDAEASVKDKD